MDLSVIIVNYNVKHFIEQCLHSVKKAMVGIEAEVIVVDNNSVDGSANLIKERFPWVKLIENDHNHGFSKANNQALKKSPGTYVLLLNPDTMVEETTFQKCLKFMDAHPEAGALGVKMIDGNGKFLPESKRGMPTPLVAFYKLSGLSKLFPRSKHFNRYHLGHLDQEKMHEVDILTGAFLFIRTAVLDKTGYLDEDYFMYGEDIDLSYRIKKEGFKNYYLPESTIIHYKGESTRKGSLNYVALFYRAMIIFYKKHLTKGSSKIMVSLILMAIYFRAGISAIKRFVSSILLPILDLSVILVGYELIIFYWAQIKFGMVGGYPDLFTHTIAPIYVLAWILGIFFSGGYRIPYKITSLVRGLVLSSLLILLAYAMLPLHLRFSRALILIGSLWSLISAISLRMVLRTIGGHFFHIYNPKGIRTLIVGSEEECDRIIDLLKVFKRQPELKIKVTIDSTYIGTGFGGRFNQIQELVRFYKINEIIFSSQDVSTGQIISVMTNNTIRGLKFKVAPPKSMSVIGSSSRHRSGDYYFQDLNPVNTKFNRKTKRSLDLVSSIIFLVISPLLFIFVKQKKGFYRNTIDVLIGEKTWIGFSSRAVDQLMIPELKELPEGIISPSEPFNSVFEQQSFSKTIVLNYAQNYRFYDDLVILLRSIRKLGDRAD